MTGLTFGGSDLFHHGRRVDHHLPAKALLDFIEFLSSLNQDVILIAHSNRIFDSLVLYNQLNQYQLWSEFCLVVQGFSDTLPLFRHMYPKRPNHKQETLVHSLLNHTYVAHDARFRRYKIFAKVDPAERQLE